MKIGMDGATIILAPELEERRAPQPRDFDWAELEAVQLGEEEAPQDSEDGATSAEQPPFLLRPEGVWTLQDLRPLSEEERLQDDLRPLSLGPRGGWLVDSELGLSVFGPAGRSTLRPGEAEGLAFSPEGALCVERRGGWLRVYDQRLREQRSLELSEDPRLLGQLAYVDSEEEDRVGAIAVSEEGEPLFSIEDEAWCDRWGLRLPPPPGWRREEAYRCVQMSEAQVIACEALGLDHAPDLQPPAVLPAFQAKLAAVDPEAEGAMERVSALHEHMAALLFKKPRTWANWIRVSRIKPTEGEARSDPSMKDSLQLLGFGEGGWAYLGAASGRLLWVSPEGEPSHYLALSEPPLQVLERGGVTALHLDGALLLLRGRRELIARIPAPSGAVLLAARAGFALLSEFELRCFSLDGARVGELRSSAPILALCPAEGGALIQSADHSARLKGLEL